MANQTINSAHRAKAVPPGKRVSLTELNKQFADNYLLTLNATKAYMAIRPDVTRRTAESNGHRLLRKAEVAEYIEQQQQTLRQAASINIQRVIQELAHIATFDPRQLFDSQGRPIPITELSSSTASALAGVEVSAQIGPEGERSRVLKYRFADKGAALDKLMKHLGGYERNRTDHASLAERIQKARDRVTSHRRNH